MANENEMQTAHAARGAQLKQTFDTAANGIFTDYVVDLVPPEESTGGGVRARQVIRLTAKDGKSLVVGAANAADGTAELRTLGCALELSQQRYGSELAIPGPEYAKFVERATDVLRVCGLRVTNVAMLTATRPAPAM
jgi:hypothetical protein